MRNYRADILVWLVFVMVLGVVGYNYKPRFVHAPAQLDQTGETTARVQKWCNEVKRAANGFRWPIEICKTVQWREGGVSVLGRSLVYAEFGDPSASNTTLIFSTIHGDEITPLYFGIQVANWVAKQQDLFGKARVVVAPMVNPDSFFRPVRTRVNAHGVDVNRNFATKDWEGLAYKTWKTKFKGDPRRNPGPRPRSEPETVFQEALIQKIRPQKILSIHAPLNFVDYDGPTAVSLAKFPYEYVHQCLELRSKLKAVSGGYFPGSLGNYAGQELGIPTLTLELPTANPAKAEEYWRRFSNGIKTMIEFQVPDYAASRIRSFGG